MKAKRTSKLKRAQTERAKPRSVQRRGSAASLVSKWRQDAAILRQEASKDGDRNYGWHLSGRALAYLEAAMQLEEVLRQNVRVSGSARENPKL